MNCESIAPEYCNFTYSLLGIETTLLSALFWDGRNCNFTYSLLGIETDEMDKLLELADCNFTYSLLGIETLKIILSLHILPVYCNFTYSLLGIETFDFF